MVRCSPVGVIEQIARALIWPVVGVVGRGLERVWRRPPPKRPQAPYAVRLPDGRWEGWCEGQRAIEDSEAAALAAALLLAEQRRGP
jgi:hypothetical protein